MYPWHEKIAMQMNNPFKIIVSTEENGFPLHWHQEIEIVYVPDGTMQIEVHKTSYAPEPGDLLFIGSCELHHFVPNPQGCHKMILQLGGSAFEDCADLVFGHRFVAPRIVVGMSQHPWLSQAAQAVYEEWREISTRA